MKKQFVYANLLIKIDNTSQKKKIEQASDCYLSLLLFEYNFHIADNSSVAWEKKNAALITGIVFGVSLVIIVTISNFCLWRRNKR